MAATLRASKQGLEIVDDKRKKKGWTKHSPKWSQPEKTDIIIPIASLKRFWRRIPIERDAFVEICQRIGVNNWEEIVDNNLALEVDSRPEFFAYDSSWVGREKLVAELTDKLRGSCRLLLILGLTGIGKTALAEKLAVELQEWFGGDWKQKLRRANFDYEDKANDFASVAARWLEEWGERLSTEDRKPEKLLYKLINYLCKNQVLILIDSLEKLLTGNAADVWGDFADEWWKRFFLNILSVEYCQSRIIITSQDLPVKLVDSRYQNFWYRKILYGLTEPEQIALFETTGLDVSEDSSDKPLLMRIGKAYKGHPLVLRVIIGEILSEPFNGDVQAYWNDNRENTREKIEEVEKDLAEAEQGKKLGDQDEWELHKLTKEVREQVNKQRLQIAFNRLARDVKEAYILLCAASVYRASEKEEYWLKHLVHWWKHLSQEECSKERQVRALEELSNRFLVEESFNHNKKRVLGQHNLIRSVAIEHHNQLLSRFKFEI
ncbi:MAG TPA: ATP-binding protein [Cyanobacteria bacterium UBA9273]|nr:ATP-binding protein [Cyanobacteria bacterium UBA9273]